MREKMLDLMKNEGLKPSQLAEMLEINPAGISHILAGRNKPGFDLLQKILRRFPQISPDWLLLDNGPMYRTQEKSTRTQLPESGGQPKNSADGLGIHPGNELFPTAAFSSTPTTSENSGASGTPLTPGAQTSGRPSAPAAVGQSGAAVARVVILYDDQTFETYTPTRR